jgi:hypothetical protein
LEKAYAPTKISLGDKERQFLLDKLKKISQYPDKISINGYGFDSKIGKLIMNDSGLEKSVDMETEVRSLLEYLSNLNEDPRYLNYAGTPIMEDLLFLISDTGLKQQIQGLGSRNRIKARKFRMFTDSLPQKTINFVNNLSKRYDLVNDMGKYKDKLEEEREIRAEQHASEPAVSTEPKTAYKDHVKDFMIDLMDLGSEHGFFTGSDIMEVFDNHYEGFMMSGADDELKSSIKNLKSDVDFAGRDYCIKDGELTYKKMRRIIDRLKAYAR